MTVTKLPPQHTADGERMQQYPPAAQWDDWEAVHSELHEPGLRLQSRDNSYEADEILIHIDGTEAWWRSE